jgi:dipeptidyl aminopeptidase/acylaminoacyl peptidase
MDSLLDVSSVNESAILPILSRTPQLFSFDLEADCKVHGMIYFPVNYTPDRKYPTVLYVYGGPKAQLVSNAYKGSKSVG